MTSAVRLAVEPSAVTTSCGLLTLGGALSLATQVTQLVDPCHAVARVHLAGLISGVNNGLLYYAVLRPSWVEVTDVCLGEGDEIDIGLSFSVQPNGSPFQPTDPCKDAVVPGNLTVAFTSAGTIDLAHTFVSLGS